MDNGKLFGGIEFGGTKTVLAVGTSLGDVVHSVTVPTTGPDTLINQILSYLSSREAEHGKLAGIGIGAFGPISVNSGHHDFGHVLETNKPGWSGFDLAGEIARGLPVPQALMTDVASAGLGEAERGALRGLGTGVYLTVGTGIGGAILHNRQPINGLMHPEIGHLPVERMHGDDAPSVCRFHSSCVEGLAAGPAIMARFGKQLNEFSPDSEEVALVGNYLGQLAANLVLTVSPERIVLGGGVSQCDGLMPRIRDAMASKLNGYGPRGVTDEGYLTRPELGNSSGIVGALIAAGRLTEGELALGGQGAM